eukprot:165019-Rhodomonas_salina.2
MCMFLCICSYAYAATRSAADPACVRYWPTRRLLYAPMRILVPILPILLLCAYPCSSYAPPGRNPIQETAFLVQFTICTGQVVLVFYRSGANSGYAPTRKEATKGLWDTHANGDPSVGGSSLMDSTWYALPTRCPRVVLCDVSVTECMVVLEVWYWDVVPRDVQYGHWDVVPRDVQYGHTVCCYAMRD